MTSTVLRPSIFQTPARKARLLLANLPVFAGLLSEDGKVLECNFGPLGGTMETRIDWVGRAFEVGPWWNYSESSRADILILLGRAQRGEPVTKERLYRKPDGHMGVMRLSLTPLFAPYGQPDAILVTAIDVTQRRSQGDSADTIAHDMAHRLRNSFTIMRTLATRATTTPGKDTQTHLSRRLSKVRESHRLSYKYLFLDVPIQDIIGMAIDDQTQLSRYEYDPVSIPADYVEAIALALGELALTGHKAEFFAQRHGSETLKLRWVEEAPRPDDELLTGLSDVLIRQNPMLRTKGQVKIENNSKGFIWRLEFQLPNLTVDKTSLEVG